MRSILAGFVLAFGLALGQPAYAQATGSPSAAPKTPPAPVGHRQPRQSDIAPPQAGDSSPAANTDNDPTRPDLFDDPRLKRALNSICRGC